MTLLPAQPKRNRTSWLATAMTQGVPIVVAALIAAFIAVFTNVQAQRATSTQLQIAERQLSTAEQGQITDRYNAAIKNLGSGSIEVRLGGIYALQRLMLDSPRDQPTVVAVPCAFVRDQTSPAGRSAQTPSSRPPADIQAALTVVGMRNTAHDAPRASVDFIGADLTGADLSFAKLTRADLTRADLTRADLTRADLTGADLVAANLTGANLARANLTGANLNNAFLTGAGLYWATLARADLSGADLHNAVLTRADLTSARLNGAHLNETYLGGADLTGAYLSGAKWPKYTPTPHGWVRDPVSGRLKRAS